VLLLAVLTNFSKEPSASILTSILKMATVGSS